MTTAVPILRVAGADAALNWWSRLGFRYEFTHRVGPDAPRFVGIRRDECRIFLSEHPDDARGPALIYLWVDDVDAVAAEFGVSVNVTPWARDCEIVDPDGNRVRVATARSTA